MGLLDGVPDDHLLSPADAGGMLGVSGQTVRRWIKQGKFRDVRRTLGGHRRVTAQEVRVVAAEMRETEHPHGDQPRAESPL